MHTGGVTRRESEIDFLFPEIELEIIDDFLFASNSEIPTGKRGISKTLRQFAKLFLGRLAFLADANDLAGYRKIKPWVLTIRGHYSSRPISKSTASFIFERVQENSKTSRNTTGHVLGVHLRLGDLLVLQEKSAVDFAQLKKEIVRVTEERDFTLLKLYSDSPEKVVGYLGLSSSNIPMEVMGCPAIDILSASADFDYFIGSNSKISYWVIFFRQLILQNGAQSIPSANVENLIKFADADQSFNGFSRY